MLRCPTLLPALVLTVALVAVLVLASATPCVADDVPDSIREHYDLAVKHLESGDLKKAYSAISKGKTKNPNSVDFWEVYVAIWRALEKKEGTLWSKIIAKAEAKQPCSPVFHLLRYRLAKSEADRLDHLNRALEIAPLAVEPRALRAREYLRRRKGDEAEVLLDAVLSEDPNNETALAARGVLELQRGRAQRALAYAEETLAEHGYPALHDLLARALLAVGAGDAGQLERAEAEAQKALEARPKAWRLALTLALVKDRRGASDAAHALLTKTQAAMPASEVAAKLGEFAFRKGDYEQAARGLASLFYEDAVALQALALCHVRRGKTTEARDAIRRLLAVQSDDATRIWAARRELELGDANAARCHITGLTGPDAQDVWVRAAAWAGDPGKARRIGGQKAQGGSREAEDRLLPIAHALLFEALGDRADAARSQLLEAAAAAGRAGVAGATVPAEEPLLPAHTLGYIQRYATYRRCLDGSFFRPAEELLLHQRDVDDVPTPTATVQGDSGCARDSKRLFPFRPADAVKGIDLQATTTNWLGMPARRRWEKAVTGCSQGCAALVGGDYVQAEQGFAHAVEIEPGWGRARLFRAVAAALAGKDLAAAAADARQAAEALIDDWDGRTAAVLVRLLAGERPTAEMKALAERRESFAPRRFDEL